MNLMISTTYPLASAMDVGKKTLELQKDPLPDYIKRLHVYVAYGGKGVKTYAFYGFEKGQEDEGVKVISRRYTKFYDVEGLEITQEIVLAMEDAMHLLGLQM